MLPTYVERLRMVARWRRGGVGDLEREREENGR